MSNFQRLSANEDPPLPTNAPVRMIQPRLAYPAICGKPDCAHLQCNVVRQQAALPCDHCREVIRPGEYLYVLERAFGVVKRQVHAKCAGENE